MKPFVGWCKLQRTLRRESPEMMLGKKVLAVIPARGGSKGLPRKNIRLLAGKPLIAWSIAAARNSAYIDECVISTEDAEIADVARAWDGDVPFLRPDHLATDEARIEDAIIDVLDRLPGVFGYVVLLQPTSPLREASDIDGCLELCLETQAPACITLSPPPKSPYLMYSFGRNAHLLPVVETKGSLRRQDLPAAFALNGAVYVAETDWFRQRRSFMSEETVGYLMPTERSADIDTLLDFRFAEFLLGDRTKS